MPDIEYSEFGDLPLEAVAHLERGDVEAPQHSAVALPKRRVAEHRVDEGDRDRGAAEWAPQRRVRPAQGRGRGKPNRSA